MSLRNSISCVSLGVACLCTGCIENDIPYPHIEGVIQEFQVEGMSGDAVFNNQARTIEVTVGEEVFIDSLPVVRLVANAESHVYPDSAACVKASNFPDFSFQSVDELPGNANTAIDFTRPVRFLLQTYQDYTWTVTVKQNIERIIEVENQAGSPQIDEQNHIVIIYVTEDTDLHQIKINKLNLEGSKTTLEPSIDEVTDFTRPRVFKAYRNGKYVCDWTVDVQHSNIPASVTSVNPWAKKAIVEGEMRGGTTPSLEYRVQGEEEWTAVDASQITETGATTFTATISGLTEATTYEVRALSNGEEGEPVTFQTETIVSIPNLNFDTWTQDGKTWYPNPVANNLDDPQAYWATGNQGVTLVGDKDSNTQPVTGNDAYKGKAAKLETISVPLVNYAAGNLFIGTYKTNMTSPANSPVFGRAYSGARPTSFSGYYKYAPSTAMSGGSIPSDRVLTVDECDIYIKLWSGMTLIAEEHFITNETVSEYTRFELPINYKDMNKLPDKITIVATSSRYGGDFDGMKVAGQVGLGSILWVDEFELGYE